jgi:hypothetical protein
MSDGFKPSDITAVGPPYLRRLDRVVGHSVCPTAAVGHNTISDALSTTA